jgi:hypothetical protein
MEANLKETQLTFSKGMTNVPSDNLCDDNTLADGYGLRVKDGELKAVRSAKSFSTLSGADEIAVYVHKTSSFSHLITLEDYDHIKAYDIIEEKDGTKKLSTSLKVDYELIPSVDSICSVGNIIIITTDNRIVYYRWKGGEYKNIGQLPDVEICADSADSNGASGREKCDGIFEVGANIGLFTDSGHSEKERDDETIGCIEKAYKMALANGYYTFPFWIRVAIRLYDGSYAKISGPVLVLPTIRCGAFLRFRQFPDEKWYPQDANYSTKIKVRIHTDLTRLLDFSDLIDKVVIFESDQVKTWSETRYTDEDRTKYNWQAYTHEMGFIDSSSVQQSGTYTFRDYSNQTSGKASFAAEFRYPPHCFSEKEIQEALLNQSVFYKVAEVGLNSQVFSSYVDLSSLIPRTVLPNLTTQEQLPNDDYYGHTTIVPSVMYSYNSRLQISNFIRYPFEGFSYFCEGQEGGGTYNNSVNTYTCYVEIETDDGSIWVSKEIKLNGNLIWFYYPDPRAKQAVFKESSGAWDYILLKVHPRLNGAYWLGTLFGGYELRFSDNQSTYPVNDKLKYETLENHVLTSEVNNPWVFNAEGDNTVGTGAIIGVCANTIALSQGQFGQHPLIVFTNEGIYALGTNSEGLYNTAYPLSREVCNNAKSITPTDGAIFFTSEKGLMMMVGSQITCVTEQLSGKTFSKDDALKGAAQNGKDTLLSDVLGSGEPSFNEYIASCMIAYDYKEKCLLLINSSKNYYYVYDIASHAVTRCNQMGYQRVVNDYPDNLLQGNDGTVYTLLNKGDANDDTNTYDGMLLSRPCKFGNAQALKSLRQILHVKDLNDNATIELHIYVSNDLKHWGEIHSLRGSGYKYFRFGMKFTGLKATDSYSGMLVLSQTRRTDKLR